LSFPNFKNSFILPTKGGINLPFSLKLRKTDPEIVLDKGDRAEIKLATLIKEFGDLPNEGATPNHKGGFDGLKGNIIAAIRKNEQDPEVMSVVRDCWNLICKTYRGGKPKFDGRDYDLPIPAPAREERKSTVVVIAKPNSQVFQHWKSGNGVAISWFRSFENGLTHEPNDQITPLTVEEWEHVVDSVWILGEKYPNFLQFFELAYGVYKEFWRDPDLEIDFTRIRLRALLRKLVPNPQKGRKAKSVENYKGACSEMLDVVQTIRFRHGGLTRIAVPKANKTFDTEDVVASLQGEALREQDIDRTEVYFGDIKLYIEVKSDVHTAVDKHDGAADQLQRIKAVVVNRLKKDALKQTPRYETRAPAVSIVNEDGWLELFTTRTARNYYKLGFYLILANKLVAPAALQTLDQIVWRDASNGKPYPPNLQSQDLVLLKEFFDKHRNSYGSFTAKLATV